MLISLIVSQLAIWYQRICAQLCIYNTMYIRNGNDMLPYLCHQNNFMQLDFQPIYANFAYYD